MFKPTKIVHLLPPAGGHECVGGGDRLPRLQAVRAKLRRGAGGGSWDGDNERGV